MGTEGELLGAELGSAAPSALGPILGATQLGLLTFLLFAGGASLIATVVARRLVTRSPALHPAIAATRLRGLLLAPLGVGLLATLVSFLPSIVASLAGVSHHCTSHGGHPHLCVVHLPSGGGSPLGWALVASTGALALARAVPLLREGLAARRLVGELAVPREGDVVTIPSREPVCLAVGWWRPVVVVSTGFLDGVGEEAATAAIAHERAHAARRDAWWTFLARLGSLALPPGVARRVLDGLELATERACDERAADEVGDRLVVADAILRAQRLGLLGEAPLVAASFGPAHWSARVTALLAPLAPSPTGFARWDARGAVVALLTVALAGPLHHAAEVALALVAP